MNDKDTKLVVENDKQSLGSDSRSGKRNSGLFSFFKWLKPSGSASRESLNSDKANNNSSSCDSLSSIKSSGTVASFSFIEPSTYTNNLSQKCIVQPPETDTYRARLKQRDKRREKDKNLTLRKKYNLFFNRDTLLKIVTPKPDESTKSLPLMTKPTMKEEPLETGFHRRTNSDSSKVKKAGAYLHVKGKRKAPQPPGNFEDSSTASLKRRNKRLAPPPPELKKEKVEVFVDRNKASPLPPRKETNKSLFEDTTSPKKLDLPIIQKETEIDHTNLEHENEIGLAEPPSKESTVTTKFPQVEENASKYPNVEQKNSDILSNDSLKLDHGILKPVKEDDRNIYSECSPFSSKESSDISKPWYKRHEASSHLKREFFKIRHESKYEPIETLPEVSFNRNSTIDLTKEKTSEEKPDKKKEDKRKSGLSILANISELDREAAEILQKGKMKNTDPLQEIPEFMKPREENKIDTDSWVSPKRRSTRDLIAKFNAITNVTKVTVNTALFGSSSKDSKKNYFGKSKEIKKQQEALLESHKKRIEMIDKKLNYDKKISMLPLMKSESASVIKKPETPKCERKSWNCPKCYIENEYWRIICHVCSAIKPYFDDLTASPNLKKNDKTFVPKDANQNQYERILERSKTQIGFSFFKNETNSDKKIDKYNHSSDITSKNIDKKEEKERLKKMLIEMKNSLPKRVSSSKIAARSSVIIENPEIDKKVIEVESSDDSSDTDNEDIRNNSPTLQCKDVKEEKKLVNGEEKEEEKVASILIATKQTIYENIKVKNASETKPMKVSSSVQTTSVIAKPPEPSKRANVTAMVKKKNSFEPMKLRDFEDIYSDQEGKSAARIYANLARNDELSLFFNMPKNLTEMKNTLSKMKLQNKNKDTIEINRLLRRLEVAIAKGDMAQAADFAKELAQLKVNCSVIRQRSSSEESDKEKSGFTVDMYVEDKISHRGPFPLQVRPEQTVGELKKQVEKEFEIPINVQRWILGKELAIDDDATLQANKLTHGCSIFLYLVIPDSSIQNIIQKREEFVNMNEPSTSASSSDNIVTKNTTTAEHESSKSNPIKPPKLYPKIDLSISEIYSEKSAVAPENGPKIIDAIPKVMEAVSQTPSHSKSAGKENLTQEKTIENKPGKHNFSEVVTQTTTTVLYAPNVHLALPEDDEEYDAKTLKPQSKEPEEWECHLCTLLNPMKSNVCGVCATVRQNPPKKVERKKIPTKPNAPQANTSGQTYLQLMNLDNEDLVNNSEPFECVVCFTEVPQKEGVTLRECLHQFCKECLRHNIEFCEDAEVKCPYRDDQYSCNIALQDREIKALVTKTVYDQHLAKSVALAENKIDKSFHCKTPDCRGWCIFEDNVNEFKCPVCRRTNCLTCQAIHMGLNCKQYQQRMTEESECDENAKQTRQMLDEMVQNGEALKCPTCQVIMMKKWGCDWLRCSMCKTEICWVTRGPRWGPAGKGDTSGGCQCGVNGVKCHPKCNYCH
ncbi:hypothetical protein HHI36_006023 [Cryptolaemus montrouzieri]|uniref:RanBP-type and C3HC4-type zinc finger-containing protein 1 n=1 Tax=Cryptolaemus montrouzieri TaxID=559131 RepID=A0ABD2NWE2_9CUCU